MEVHRSNRNKALDCLTSFCTPIDSKRVSADLANRLAQHQAKKNPASVAADRGAIDRKHHGSDRKASYGDKARRATDRLRDLARDLRRGPDPYRTDPERAYAHRDSIAHQLRLIADELEASS